jgi:hypothetical protein
VALLLDLFEEFRLLSAGERCLHERCQAAAALFINQRAARWKQHGKCRAVKEGDSNTRYFHARATIRRRQCQIRQIVIDGVPLIAHGDKVSALTEYYTMLLGRGSPGRWHFDVHDIYSSMPTADAQLLVAPFTASEALQVVRSMNINSAPGPDGFGPAWYVATWETVRPYVMRLLAAFHSNNVDLGRINRAHIVLLPKKEAAIAPGDFRPISLQNCSVKIISKILTTRLQK